MALAGGAAKDHPLRPMYKDSFHPSQAKAIIKEVLHAKLGSKTYNPELTSQWTREIADEIKHKLKELSLPRYKFVVNVAIGEQRGEGIRIACRCLWDSDTDAFAEEVFMNVRARPRRCGRGPGERAPRSPARGGPRPHALLPCAHRIRSSARRLRLACTSTDQQLLHRFWCGSASTLRP